MRPGAYKPPKATFGGLYAPDKTSIYFQGCMNICIVKLPSTSGQALLTTIFVIDKNLNMHSFQLRKISYYGNNPFLVAVIETNKDIQEVKDKEEG